MVARFADMVWVMSTCAQSKQFLSKHLFVNNNDSKIKKYCKDIESQMTQSKGQKGQLKVKSVLMLLFSSILFPPAFYCHYTITSAEQ